MKRNVLFTIASFLTMALPLLLSANAIIDIAISAIAVLFLIHSLLTKEWKWIKQPWLQWLFFLWGYMCLRSLFAQVPHDALARSLPFPRYFIFAAALAFWTLQDSFTRKWFFTVLSVVILFIAADGLLQWAHGIDILHAPAVIQPDGNLRLTGIFGKRPILGIMLAWFFFPVCLTLMTPRAGKNNYLHLTLGGLASLLVFTAIALSGERMALLLTLMGWFIALWLMPLARRITLPTFIACALVLGLLACSNAMLKHRQLDSTVATVQHWQDSPYGQLLSSDLRLAKANLLFGVGANHFRIACPELYRDSPQQVQNFCNTHPHNTYMEWLIEEGVVGFGLYIAFLIAIARLCLHSYPLARANPVFAGLIVALIMRLWPLASSTGVFSRWGAPPFWLVLGTLLVYTVREPTGKRHDADASLAVKNTGI